MNTTPSSQSDGAPARTGGAILADALKIHGVDRVFGVPGESALAYFDALYGRSDRPAFIVCRHEAPATHMAEADGKLKHRPGIAIVSRGPGAMQASIGLHTAFQDSTPLILIVAQVSRAFRGREGFQEMDFDRVFMGMTKLACEINSPEKIPEYVSRAHHVAMHGRPGPVVLSIPEDVLAESCRVADVAPFLPVEAAPSSEDMARLGELLASARQPILIVGGGGWDERSARSIQGFAEANDLPVVAAFRAQDIVDNRSDVFAGHLAFGVSPALAARVTSSDLLIAVGDRLGEVTTNGYKLIEPPMPKQRLVHVYPGAEELGRVYRAALPIVSGVRQFAARLGDVRLSARHWKDWRREMRAEYLQNHKPLRKNDELDLSGMIAMLRERLPDDAIVTNGAGNYNIWLHRFFSYRRFGTQIAPRAGVMGYGLPAAIAAKLRHPERTVIALAGDGCFMMASPDFATAAQYRLRLTVIVVNNSLYGSIRMHQERHYPGRPSATILQNPDFAALARAHGAHGETVLRNEDFPAALDRALAFDGPSLIEIHADPKQLTPDWKL